LKGFVDEFDCVFCLCSNQAATEAHTKFQQNQSQSLVLKDFQAITVTCRGPLNDL